MSRIDVRAESGPATRVALRVMSSAGVSSHALPACGEILIGRSDRCGIVVADSMLSREHAVVRVGEAMEIVDLGSSNGTKVGDRTLLPHTPEPIAVGDVITLGASVILVHEIGDHRSVPPSPRSERPSQRPDADRLSPTSSVRRRRLVPRGAIEQLRPVVERIAAGTISVLIVGETGVGKDVLANMLHALSPRSASPIICVNCAALPEQLLEAELFGYERGAFTGARQAKPGLIEAADGGTMFLDEIGELPFAIQAKLLRAVEEQEVMRIGALKPRRVDVRFVAATHRDLETEVTRGTFREDLYYRLNGVMLSVPPLRERGPEIVPLARVFAEAAARRMGRAAPELDDGAVQWLESHTWPGNVRELRNVVERAMLLAGEGLITAEHLPIDKPPRSARPAPPTVRDLEREAVTEPPPLRTPFEEQRDVVVEALRRCGGNQTHAAAFLGISRRALITRIAKYGIERPRRGIRP